jgi:hypothetical protein
MQYYFIKHNIHPGDRYVVFESGGSLERTSQRQPYKTIYYEGEFETDFISGEYGFSAAAKEFFRSLEIPHMTFIPVMVRHRKWEESMEIYLMKVNREIDAVDYERSDLFRLSDGHIRESINWC